MRIDFLEYDTITGSLIDQKNEFRYTLEMILQEPKLIESIPKGVQIQNFNVFLNDHADILDELGYKLVDVLTSKKGKFYSLKRNRNRAKEITRINIRGDNFNAIRFYNFDLMFPNLSSYKDFRELQIKLGTTEIDRTSMIEEMVDLKGSYDFSIYTGNDNWDAETQDVLIKAVGIDQHSMYAELGEYSNVLYIDKSKAHASELLYNPQPKGVVLGYDCTSYLQKNSKNYGSFDNISFEKISAWENEFQYVDIKFENLKCEHININYFFKGEDFNYMSINSLRFIFKFCTFDSYKIFAIYGNKTKLNMFTEFINKTVLNDNLSDNILKEMKMFPNSLVGLMQYGRIKEQGSHLAYLPIPLSVISNIKCEVLTTAILAQKTFGIKLIRVHTEGLIFANVKDKDVDKIMEFCNIGLWGKIGFFKKELYCKKIIINDTNSYGFYDDENNLLPESSLNYKKRLELDSF